MQLAWSASARLNCGRPPSRRPRHAVFTVFTTRRSFGKRQTLASAGPCNARPVWPCNVSSACCVVVATSLQSAACTLAYDHEKWLPAFLKGTVPSPFGPTHTCSSAPPIPAPLGLRVACLHTTAPPISPAQRAHCALGPSCCAVMAHSGRPTGMPMQTPPDKIFSHHLQARPLYHLPSCGPPLHRCTPASSPFALCASHQPCPSPPSATCLPHHAHQAPQSLPRPRFSSHSRSSMCPPWTSTQACSLSGSSLMVASVSIAHSSATNVRHAWSHPMWSRKT